LCRLSSSERRPGGVGGTPPAGSRPRRTTKNCNGTSSQIAGFVFGRHTSALSSGWTVPLCRNTNLLPSGTRHQPARFSMGESVESGSTDPAVPRPGGASRRPLAVKQPLMFCCRPCPPPAAVVLSLMFSSPAGGRTIPRSTFLPGRQVHAAPRGEKRGLAEGHGGTFTITYSDRTGAGSDSSGRGSFILGRFCQ